MLKTYTPMPDARPAKSFTLLTDDRQITFVPPHDSIVQLHKEKKEVWISFRDDRCLIKVQLSTNSPALAAPEYNERLHQLVQDRYPDAEVGPSAFCYNRCSPGRYIDIKRFTAYNTKLTTRLAFVPFKGGMLEVSLTAAEAKFPKQVFALTRVLNSFLVEKPNLSSLSLRMD